MVLIPLQISVCSSLTRLGGSTSAVAPIFQPVPTLRNGPTNPNGIFRAAGSVELRDLSTTVIPHTIVVPVTIASASTAAINGQGGVYPLENDAIQAEGIAVRADTSVSLSTEVVFQTATLTIPSFTRYTISVYHFLLPC